MTAATQPSVKVTVMQGEAHASHDERVVMSTVLGSCISTCLYDPVARIGGMNHFLLAKPMDDHPDSRFDKSYGLFLMELLINEMIKLGAEKRRMKARLYGGANISSNIGPIGSANARFARQFLADEGIETVHTDLEGNNARRVEFRPATGQVRARQVPSGEPAPIPAPTQKPEGKSQDQLGSVELF